MASPGTVLEVPVRLTMNGVVLPTTSPTYWIDPTLTFTAQSRDPYLVVPGIQTAKVELDPQNLISETTEADNVRWYAWESQGVSQDIGITSVTLSPSSLTVPLRGDSVVLNVVLTGSGIPLAGMITLIAVLDDYTTEVLCGSLDISGSTFSSGTATVSVNCTTENARVGIAYVPVVRVTASGFVDADQSNNEGYGDHYIIPQSAPIGNIRIISGSLPLAEVNIFNTSGGYVTTAWPLSDGTVFLNLSVGTYLMAVETTISAPLFDANGYPAFAIAANPTSDTAPAVSLDKARYSCPSGYCMQMTVGSESSFFGRLMRMASVAMAATSSAEEQAKRDRLAWEGAYAMVGCNKGLPNTPKDKGGDCSNVSKYVAEVFDTSTNETKQLPSVYSYLNSDPGAAELLFRSWSDGGYGWYGTCYGHVYDYCTCTDSKNSGYRVCNQCGVGCTCYPYTCWVQADPLRNLAFYSYHIGLRWLPDGQFVMDGDYPRGGQCKAFVNLLLYRSGIYQGPAPTYTFKRLPNDDTIDLVAPMVAGGSLRIGDALRNTVNTGHALVVLARIEPKDGKPLSALVMDSNFIKGSDGHEIIGTHVMTINELSSYRDLDCVYAGTC